MRQEAFVPRADGVEVQLPEFMEEIVAEVTFEARSSPDISQTSGVSVRMSIANYETVMANALRRALRNGEKQAVPRISDLPSMLASTTGKIELEYAGAERSDEEVVRALIERATRRVFDARISLEGVASVVEAFDQGWQVEVSEDLAASEYLEGLDEIPGLRAAATQLAGGDSAERMASAIEFILEGLHLSNRLNKAVLDGSARYQKA